MEFLNTLDVKQLIILEEFINGNNVFMSGPGGTGKSYLINVIKHLCLQSKKNFDITAMTGCAAVLIQGKTIQSWGGTGIINSVEIKEYIKRINRNKKIINWIEIDVLIVDEVSMLSKKTFNILDNIAKSIRKNDKPFGGIQLVFSGDFYQLPPVNDNEVDEDASLFCFESDIWSETFTTIHNLTKIFRQKDKEFSKLLNNIRIGNITESNLKILKSRIIPYENNDIIPTKLFPTNDSVKSINKIEHDKLSDRSCKTFGIQVIPPTLKDICENDISDWMIKKSSDDFKHKNEPIEIKIGDQVICTYNISEKIVNGSRGVVVDIQEYPMVKFISGSIIEMKPIDIHDDKIPSLIYKKIPLDYAWALTIHKSQGMTLDLCIMDLGYKVFTAGQMYVALSRVKSLDGLYLLNFNHNKIKTLKKVKNFYAKYENKVFTKEERISEKKRIKKLITNYLKECGKNKIVKKQEPPINTEIINKLKGFRAKVANEKEIPYFRVITNETLANIANDLPKDYYQLGRVKGVGPKTLETYGNDILKILQ